MATAQAWPGRVRCAEINAEPDEQAAPAGAISYSWQVRWETRLPASRHWLGAGGYARLID